MAAKVINLYYDLDRRNWYQGSAANSAPQAQPIVIGQTDTIDWVIRFVKDALVYELPGTPAMTLGFKARGSYSASYLLQTTSYVKTGTTTSTKYTFSLDTASSELTTYLASITEPDNYVAMQITDTVNDFTTLPALDVRPLASYQVTGAAPTSANGTLVVAAGKTATINNTVTLTGTDGTTYDLAAIVAGGVSSVAQSFTGGIISVAGSPITTSGTLALTVAGTSGGIPYFSSATTWATSAALAAGAIVIGGGAGAAPTSTTSPNIGTATGTSLAITGNLGTNGENSQIYATGTNGFILTSGANGTIGTLGSDATISTQGANAAIITLGASATISTQGASAHISTTNAAAYIQSRSTFKLYDGTYITTLSHAPTANRAIALPDAAGTLLIGDEMMTAAQAGLTYHWDPVDYDDTTGTWTAAIGATDFVQATATNRPAEAATGINSLPAVLFDGVDNFLSIANFTLGIDCAFFFVWKQNHAGADTGNFCMEHGAAIASNDGVWIQGMYYQTQMRRAATNIFTIISNNGVRVEKMSTLPRIGAVIYRSGIPTVWVDGLQLSLSAQAFSATFTATDATATLYLGALTAATVSWSKGWLGEFAIKNGQMTNRAAMAYMRYLGNKYGVVF